MSEGFESSMPALPPAPFESFCVSGVVDGVGKLTAFSVASAFGPSSALGASPVPSVAGIVGITLRTGTVVVGERLGEPVGDLAHLAGSCEFLLEFPDSAFLLLELLAQPLEFVPSPSSTSPSTSERILRNFLLTVSDKFPNRYYSFTVPALKQSL